MERNCIFPDDLVEEILSRLPVKDLLRARCVSKTWCALIDDVSFIRKHYQLQYSLRKLDDNMTYFIDHMVDFEKLESHFYLLSIQQQGSASALTVDLMDDLERDMNAVLPYGADEYEFRCYGRVNGIICLTCESRKTHEINDSFVALWNPATREFKTLAYPNNDPGLIHCLQFEIAGFGFDLSASDFKILAGYFVWGELDQLVPSIYYCVLYSLKSNSWKRIRTPPAHISGLPMTFSDGYLNGVYYWVTEEDSDIKLQGDVFIVSFNFTAEVFKVSDLPHDAMSLVLATYPYHKTIALYKERLALAMSFKVQNEAAFNIHIWVATRLDDCGVPLSWQHLFTVEAIPEELGVAVETILMNGDLHISFASDNDIENPVDYLYNHSIGEFKKSMMWWAALFRYVESLFPLSKRLVQN